MVQSAHCQPHKIQKFLMAQPHPIHDLLRRQGWTVFKATANHILHNLQFCRHVTSAVYLIIKHRPTAPPLLLFIRIAPSTGQDNSAVHAAARV